jgi:2-isopropylmalate synthase
VGANAFSHSSGIHQDGVLKSKSTYEIMTPRSVGLKENRMVLTSRSGSHMVKSRLLSLGYGETEFDMPSFYERFKALADKKGTVYDDDLLTLMESDTTHGVQDTFVLHYLNVSSGTGTVPTATLRISAHGKIFQEAACGDGAFDATTKAIDRVTGYRIRVDDFHIDSVTEGREAVGRVTIVGNTTEGRLTGVGTSTDIVEASALAYMDIVNKFSRMKQYKKQRT